VELARQAFGGEHRGFSSKACFSDINLIATLRPQYYWSGIAALVPLAWLCFASLAPIRRAAYECFKWLHLVSAILFSAFFYIHCNAVSLHTNSCTSGEAIP
jgi:hypothetical protein